VPEVMEALALGRYKIYDLIRSGQLESIQVGRSRRVPVEAVDACVARLREEAA
jgi:excisionase family DNA binding protein